MVSNERYARADASVTGQVLKIVALKPDAVITGTSGTPGALPYLALHRARLQGPDLRHACADQPGLRARGRRRGRRPAGTDRAGDRGRAVAGVEPDPQGVDGLPRGLPEGQRRGAERCLLGLQLRRLADLAGRRARAPKGEPGTPAYRVALRDAIVTTKELVGTHSVYNFKPDNRYGSDERSRVVVKLEKGQWKLVHDAPPYRSRHLVWHE